MNDTADARPAPLDDPAALRAECRAGRFDGPTAGQAPGRVQANPMAVPKPGPMTSQRSAGATRSPAG